MYVHIPNGKYIHGIHTHMYVHMKNSPRSERTVFTGTTGMSIKQTHKALVFAIGRAD
jgi:hypothetical protein